MGRINKLRIFISGASGFIGRNLSEYLQKKYILYSPSHKELDLLNDAQVVSYIRSHKINIIIHCANVGGGRDTMNLQDIVYINLRMFFNIVRCAQYVKRIIHFGSGAEYDKRNPLVKLRETDFDKTIPSDQYGFYKYICSKYIENATNIICLRLFGIYGKYENYLFKFISNAIVKNLLRMPIVIKQNVYFDYLYIDDLYPMIEYFLHHNPKYKQYNIATGKPIDLITLGKTINVISTYKTPIYVQNKKLNNEYTADNNRIASEIKNLTFTTHHEGIRKLYMWYKKNLKSIDINQVKIDPYIHNIHVKR